MTNMDGSPEALVRQLQALSAPARLRVVELLKGRALCVNALTARLGITQGAVSQHLRILREAGFVVAEKRGYYVHYALNEARLAEFQEALGAFLSEGGGASDEEEGSRKGAGTCAKRRRAAKSRKS